MQLITMIIPVTDDCPELNLKCMFQEIPEYETICKMLMIFHFAILLHFACNLGITFAMLRTLAENKLGRRNIPCTARNIDKRHQYSIT